MTGDRKRHAFFQTKLASSSSKLARENIRFSLLLVAGDVACVASVSVRFRSKERGTRVKDHAKNGVGKRAAETKRKRLLSRVPGTFRAKRPNRRRTRGETGVSTVDRKGHYNIFFSLKLSRDN